MKILIFIILCILNLNSSNLTMANQAYLKGDYTKAYLLYEDACDEKRYVACYNIGLAYEHGNIKEIDYEKASEYYTKACDGDVFNSCYNLGLLYDKESTKNKSKVIELYTKSCEGGVYRSCHNLASLYTQRDLHY